MTHRAATPKVHHFERITTAQGDERYEIHHITNLRSDGSEWHDVRVWDTHQGGNGYVWSPAGKSHSERVTSAQRKARALNRRWIVHGKSAYQH